MFIPQHDILSERRTQTIPSPVLVGLVPAIQVLSWVDAVKTWMPGTSPGMTIGL
jgi:hypothetical protein